MEAVLLSIGLVFLAELGDKSQLIAVTLTSRYGPRTVLAGITVATGVMSLASAFLGEVLSDVVPTDVLTLVAGLAFLVFAVITLLPEKDEIAAPRPGLGIVVVALTFAAAELGDKTMLATMTLATQHPWWLVAIGSAVGEILAVALAVLAGHAFLSRVPEKTVHAVAAAAFAVLGVLLVAEAVGRLG